MSTFIGTLRHGGSAEPALPMARRRIRPVSEKVKRNSPGIHPCSQLNCCPKGKTRAISGSSCINLVHIKAQESQGSGKGLWTQGTKPLCSQGVCF